MALTEATRLRLEGKGFDKLFSKDRSEWTNMAEEARKLMASRIKNEGPRVDDIRKALLPLVEIHPKVRKFLADDRLTQKYWIGDFTDYILHHVYKPKLEAPAKGKSHDE